MNEIERRRVLECVTCDEPSPLAEATPQSVPDEMKTPPRVRGGVVLS